MIVCFLIVGFFALSIMPLNLKIQLFFSSKNKKLYFKINLFNIKIFGGYIEVVSGKIFLHLSKNKALILSLNAFDFRKRFNYTKEFKLYSIYNIVETGNNGSITPFLICFFENIFTKIAFCVDASKNSLKLKNNVLIYEYRTVFKFNGEVVVLFNLISVFVTFFKIISENLFNERKK